MTASHIYLNGWKLVTDVDASGNHTLQMGGGGIKAWVTPAAVTTVAATATDILAAGLATNGLILWNEHATESCRIRFDGSDATSTRGIPLAAGKGLLFSAGQVPSGKISGYSTNASLIGVAYF